MAEAAQEQVAARQRVIDLASWKEFVEAVDVDKMPDALVTKVAEWFIGMEYPTPAIAKDAKEEDCVKSKLLSEPVLVLLRQSGK